MDGRLAGLSRDWVALDSATKDNLERVKGGESMLRKAQEDVEMVKRCLNKQTSIMAFVSYSFIVKLLIHPYILAGQWQVLMWGVGERKGDEGKSSRHC